VSGPVASSCPAVYQIRVVLAGISPLIWRRLLVGEHTSIAELHTVLQIAFGWSDEHLNRFTIHGREYGVYHEGGPWFRDNPRQVRLAHFAFRPGERFRYEYDFIDAWRHDLRIEAVHPGRPELRHPVCTGAARSAPPEDCGGPLAFLALRQRHSRWATAVRMAHLLGPVLEAPAEQTVREALGEHQQELAELLYWSRIDDCDRPAVNWALAAWFCPRKDSA
jgi:hypothetical protein